MSRELRELISQLEQERQDIQDFYEEVQAQLASGEVTPELAAELLRREFRNIPYQELIAEQNRLLTEAHNILRQETRELTIKATPAVIIILLAVGVAWNFTAITGFLTLGANENFYRLDIAQQYNSTTAIPLAIDANISSLRVDGSISGVGTAKLWLEANGAKFLVASFTSSESTGLTGFFTAGDTTDNATNTSNETANLTENVTLPNVTETVSNDTNVTENVVNETAAENVTLNETNLTENVSNETITVENVTNVTENISNETTVPENVSNETNQTVENLTNETNVPPENVTNVTENVTNETPVVVLPQQPEQQATPKTITLTKACAETCNLPEVSPQYTLDVEIDGNVTVTIDSVIYGVPIQPENFTNLTANVTENVTNETNLTNETGVPVNVTNITENVTVPETNVTLPNETNETNVTAKQLGEVCAADSDCASSTCVQSTYQGALTQGICAADRTWCVENATAYPESTVLNDSTCYAGTSGIWVASPSQGRFDIKDNANRTVGVIDKYGNMAVSGNATFNMQPTSTGWVLRDSSQTPRVSVDSDGNLLAAGNLTTRTAPQPTTGGDLIIQNADNSTVAVLTENGNIELVGDFQAGVRLS